MLDPKPNLYHRIGGYDAVAAFADDLLPRLINDSALGVYWKGKSTDSLRKERQLLVDFLCMTFGGPVHYFGRDMKSSHAGLGISESEWDIFARHAIDTLNDLGVPEAEKAEILSIAAGFKNNIVEKGKPLCASHAPGHAR
jgi:hemoglobin